MKSRPLRHLLIGISMLVAAGLALALTPRPHASGRGPDISLETMIPPQFGEWRQDASIAPTIYNPVVQAEVDRIYSQTLDRVYVNDKGDRIMLMIAYGGGQSYSMQVHRPEMCYPSLGFQVGDTTKSTLRAGDTDLPVMKLVATQGPRIEPITYWVMIGDSVVRGNFEQHLARLKYGLTGRVPHGMLIRVSTISDDASRSYRIEEAFVSDMLGAVPAQYRRLFGGAG